MTGYSPQGHAAAAALRGARPDDIAVLADLALIDAAYNRLYGHGLEKGIKKECSGSYKEALIACVHPTRYVARLLRKSMKGTRPLLKGAVVCSPCLRSVWLGLGTRDNMLIRLIAHRPKEEMKAIKAAFLEMFGKTLASWIIGDTSVWFLIGVCNCSGCNGVFCC